APVHVAIAIARAAIAESITFAQRVYIITDASAVAEPTCLSEPCADAIAHAVTCTEPYCRADSDAYSHAAAHAHAYSIAHPDADRHAYTAAFAAYIDSGERRRRDHQRPV